MAGGLGILLGGEELLVELFSVTETGEFHLDICAATEADHLLGKVQDLHGFTHIEDVDLSSIAHGTGFQHQLAGLGDGHEVADDVRMRNRNGTTALNLLTEQRNHGTIGAQHIAKAGGDELRAGRVVLLDFLGQCLHIDFADALGAAHDVGRVHGFVGGDHHKAFHIVFDGKVGQDFGSEDIVLDGLRHVVFHHGNVLVGGGMEHVFGPVVVKDFLHAPLVGDIGHDGGCLQVAPFGVKLQADVVERGLGLVHQDELVGVEDGHLTHDFRADGTGCARDEHAFSFQVRANLLEVDLDGVSAQEVLNLDLADLAGLLHALPVVGDVRGQVNGYVFLEEAVCDIRVLEVIGLYRRHDDGLYVVLADVLQEVFVIEVHVHAHHHLALHHGVIGNESLEVEFVGTGHADGLGDVDATVLGAVDERVAGFYAVLVEGVVERLDGHAHEGHEHEHHDVGDGQHANVGNEGAGGVEEDDREYRTAHERAHQRYANVQDVRERGETKNV